MSMADRIAVLHHGRVQQVDPPVALYRQPVNVFVGDFIGTSNLFTGRAAGHGVEVPGLGLLPGSGDVPVGSAARLLVRPEDVRLVPDRGHLSGAVVDTAFVGGVSTTTIQVPGLSQPVLATHPGVAAVPDQAEVHLTWDPAVAVVLPD